MPRRRLFPLAVLLGPLVGLLLGARPAEADILLVPASEDSAPYSFLPNLARGASPTLYAFRALDSSSLPHDFVTFLWFDVEQADLPTGHVLVEATLVVTYAFDFTGFGDTSTAPGTLECREALGPWSTTTLTWSNRPPVSAAFDTIGPITGFGALLCDATPVVLDWIGLRRVNEGFALTSPTARVMGMHALESSVDPSLKPTLVLRTELPEPDLAIGLAIGIGLLARSKRALR